MLKLATTLHIIAITVVVIAAVVAKPKVKVRQCPPGRGGDLCQVQCPMRCVSCERGDQCQLCQGNYQTPECRDCRKGFFGVNCREVCSGCETCHAKTGACPMCKEAGLALPDCISPCPNGTYGMHCSERCPLVCDTTCDAKTGECLQCAHGDGKQCSLDCSRSENVETCQLYCKGMCKGICNTTTQQCDLCASGLKGSFCNESCGKGYYGRNCAEKCSSNCKAASCDPVTGVCKECKSGFTGSRCALKHVCPAGFFGSVCSSPCPQTCASDFCNPLTGTCLTCHPGYGGDMCDEPCSNGTYGQDCRHTCPENCADHVCAVTSGVCTLCIPGYRGDFCNATCKNGSWGNDCANTCSEYCANGTCDYFTGHCHSCISQRSGNFCTVEFLTEEQSSWNFLPVDIRAVYIFLGLLALVFIIACPMTIYHLKGKIFLKKTRQKVYRDKALKKVDENLSLQAPVYRPDNIPKPFLKKCDIGLRDSDVYVNSAGISLQSYTKSSMSKSNASKFNSNIEFTTKWLTPRNLDSGEASRGTKSNSLAVDILLNEYDSQKSTDDIRSLIENGSRNEIVSAQDASKTKSFKGSVHFQQDIDPMSISNSTSQTLSISEHYPKSFLSVQTKTTTDMKSNRNYFDNSPKPSLRDSFDMSEPLENKQINDGMPPSASQSNAMKSVSFFESNPYENQNLTVVKLWKSNDGCVERNISVASRDNRLTTFLAKETSTLASPITPGFTDSQIKTENQTSPYKSLTDVDNELSSLSNDQQSQNLSQSIPKNRERPLIQKMFDSVLDAMKSDSNLYQNKKNEIDIEHTERDSTEESLPVTHSKTDHVSVSSRHTSCSPEAVRDKDGHASKKGSLDIRLNYNELVKESPPQQSLTKLYEVSQSNHSHLDIPKDTNNLNEIKEVPKRPHRSKKTNGFDARVNLKVGTSPTSSSTHHISDHNTRPHHNSRNNVSKWFKIMQSSSTGSDNYSQASLVSESLSQFSDQHIDGQPDKSHLILSYPKDTAIEQSVLVTTLDSSSKNTSGEIMTTGISPVKSQPTQPNPDVPTASNSVSRSLPEHNFTTAIEPSTITGTAERTDMCTPWYKSTSSLLKYGTDRPTDSINQANFLEKVSSSKPSEVSSATIRSNTRSTLSTNIPTPLGNNPRNTNVIRCSTTREISPMSYSKSSHNIPEPISTQILIKSPVAVYGNSKAPPPSHLSTFYPSFVQSTELASATTADDINTLEVIEQPPLVNDGDYRFEEETRPERGYRLEEENRPERDYRLEEENRPVQNKEYKHTDKRQVNPTKPDTEEAVFQKTNWEFNLTKKTQPKPDTPRPSISESTHESDTDSNTMMPSWKSLSQTDRTLKKL